MGNNEYNWIDDPFDEKKAARLEGMGKGSKTAFALGLLAVAILVLVVLFLVGLSFISFASI